MVTPLDIRFLVVPIDTQMEKTVAETIAIDEIQKKVREMMPDKVLESQAAEAVRSYQCPAPRDPGGVSCGVRRDPCSSGSTDGLIVCPL